MTMLTAAQHRKLASAFVDLARWTDREIWHMRRAYMAEARYHYDMAKLLERDR